MNDFWNNIVRYPWFFISSLIGLILVILAPFRNLFKLRKFRITLIGLGLLFFVSLIIIIQAMTGF